MFSSLGAAPYCGPVAVPGQTKENRDEHDGTTTLCNHCGSKWHLFGTCLTAPPKAKSYYAALLAIDSVYFGDEADAPYCHEDDGANGNEDRGERFDEGAEAQGHIDRYLFSARPREPAVLYDGEIDTWLVRQNESSFDSGTHADVVDPRIRSPLDADKLADTCVDVGGPMSLSASASYLQDCAALGIERPQAMSMLQPSNRRFAFGYTVFASL